MSYGEYRKIEGCTCYLVGALLDHSILCFGESPLLPDALFSGANVQFLSRLQQLSPSRQLDLTCFYGWPEFLRADIQYMDS